MTFGLTTQKTTEDFLVVTYNRHFSGFSSYLATLWYVTSKKKLFQEFLKKTLPLVKILSDSSYVALFLPDFSSVSLATLFSVSFMGSSSSICLLNVCHQVLYIIFSSSHYTHNFLANSNPRHKNGYSNDFQICLSSLNLF